MSISLKQKHIENMVNQDNVAPSYDFNEAVDKYISNGYEADSSFIGTPSTRGKNIEEVVSFVNDIKENGNILQDYIENGIGICKISGSFAVFKDIEYNPEIITDMNGNMYEPPEEIKRIKKKVYATVVQNVGDTYYKIYDEDLERVYHYHSMNSSDCLGNINSPLYPIYDTPARVLLEFFRNYELGLREIYTDSLGTSGHIDSRNPYSRCELQKLRDNGKLNELKNSAWLGRKDDKTKRKFDRYDKRKDEKELYHPIFNWRTIV